MLSFLRGREPTRSDTSKNNPIHYESSTSTMEFHPLISTSSNPSYFTTHTIPTCTSMFNPPPFHLHLHQTEDFLVHPGTDLWHLPTHPSPSSRQQIKTAGESITIPAGKFHRLENTSPSDPLTVSIALDPSKPPLGTEEAFFRYFFGYLEDCQMQGISPSFFQLGLFSCTVDGPVAIPVPGPDWLKRWVSRVVGVVLGVGVGEWILGYRRSYSEYFREEYAKTMRA